MLGHHRAHEQAAVAAALDGQLVRVRVFLIDQILGGGREIIEDVLLFGEVPGLVPFFAELAAAAHVGHDIDAAAIEPEPPGEIEGRRHADAVTAVAIKQRRIVSVQLRSLSAGC